MTRRAWRLLYLLRYLLVFSLVACSGDGGSNRSDGGETGTAGSANLTSGALLQGGELGMAINGRGYFIAKDHLGATYYLRSADFTLDNLDRIVTEGADELTLQGSVINSNGAIVRGVLTDIDTSLFTVDVEEVGIDEGGFIYSLENGRRILQAQIFIADFANAYQLTSLKDGVWQESIESGPSVIGHANTGAFGEIVFDKQLASTLDLTLTLAAPVSQFLMLNRGGSILYAQTGQFFVNTNGFFVTEEGYGLSIYPAFNQNIQVGVILGLQLASQVLSPEATSLVGKTVELDASEQRPISLSFDPEESSSYHFSTSTYVFDSLGLVYTFELFFVREAGADNWDLYYQFDGSQWGGPYEIQFDQSGAVTNISSVVTTELLDPGSGAREQTIDIRLDLITLSNRYRVVDTQLDGHSALRYTGLAVDECGVIRADYDFGSVKRVLGQVLQVTFPNPDGLTEIAPGYFGETIQSGQPSYGSPCGGSFQSIIGDSIQ